MPFYAGQGFGIPFPAVMDLQVQIFDLTPNHMCLSARCEGSGSGLQICKRERYSGEQTHDCSIIVPGHLRLVRWSDPWLRDGDDVLLELLVHGNHSVNMNYSVCLEQYYSPIGFLLISAIFSVGRKKDCLLCI